jgi:hypothetical protein
LLGAGAVHHINFGLMHCNKIVQVAIIREPDRKQVYAVVKLHGVSEQTIYIWPQAVGRL